MTPVEWPNPGPPRPWAITLRGILVLLALSGLVFWAVRVLNPPPVACTYEDIFGPEAAGGHRK